MVRVARAARRLHRLVGELGRLGRAAEDQRGARPGEEQRHEQVAAAGGARDGDAAREVVQPGAELLEVDLGPPEVPERREVAGQLGVRERVERGHGAGEPLPRGRDLAGRRVRERQHGGRHALGEPVAELARDRRRLRRDRARCGEVERVQVLDRPLDTQVHGARGALVPEVVQRGVEPDPRLLVAAEPVLDRGAEGDQPHAPRVAGREQLERLLQRRAALLQPPARPQRVGELDQQLDAPGDPGMLRVLGHEPDGGLQPARRGGGRPGRAGRGGLAQQRDRRLVAAARGVLDVVRLCGGRRRRAPSARRRPARARRAASRRRRARRRRAARADGGSGTAAGRRSGGRGRGPAARPAPP